MTGICISLLYRFLLGAAMPFLALYFLVRTARTPAYWRTLAERLGCLPGPYHETPAGGIWLHAVSVGEVLSVAGLVGHLRRELPGTPVWVSTTTLAGRALAEERLRGLADGIFFAPLDYVFAVRRVLRTLRPAVVVVAETEIWPNLFTETRRAGLGLVVINGRISDRVAARYARLRWFFRHTLSKPGAILVQTEEMRRRYLAAGAPPDLVRVGGNLKFDIQPPPPPMAVIEFLDRTAPEAVWIAASTMPPDEEATVIGAFQELSAARPGLLLVLAPRKPERFALAAELLERAGTRYVRRSALAPLALPGVLLLDTIGELAGLFGRADVVFIGGSIVTHGGHNPLEPAGFARAIVVGRYMQNFPEMAAAFRGADAWVEVDGAEGLAPAVAALLDDPARCIELGERAKRCAAAQTGATENALAAILEAHDAAVPRVLPGLHRRLLLGPLTLLWRAGMALDQRLRRPRRLPAPVVSVGNLATGGTGKTPLVAWLAGRIEGGAILTRGYGRRERAVLALPAGATEPRERTGDEAQIYLRAGVARVGIGSDRLAAAALLRPEPPAFLLDDGFQHWPLARDCDIVLLDGAEPFGPVLPLGRFREGPEALARAAIVVITRRRRPAPGIVAHVRRYNATAPVFRTWLEPVGWVEGATGRRLPLSDTPGPAAAFCGLGSPHSFWRTLAELGAAPVARQAFPDHHTYSVDELAGLRRLAPRLLTTEKDWVNCPLDEPGIYWLEAKLVFDDEPAFLEAVFRAARVEVRPGA
ncbi:MAG: tetraacyldisaccharide 4'-kinase [Bryobacterales bacterium]|nr:tetraacyldisaccharide 4'-kinase [Bryobacterales bacterium]